MSMMPVAFHYILAASFFFSLSSIIRNPSFFLLLLFVISYFTIFLTTLSLLLLFFSPSQCPLPLMKKRFPSTSKPLADGPGTFRNLQHRYVQYIRSTIFYDTTRHKTNLYYPTLHGAILRYSACVRTSILQYILRHVRFV
jgi:hypothetical protein